MLVVSNSEHSLVPEIANGITVDFADIEDAYSRILDVANELNILCVLATDDSCVELASRIAQAFNLPQNKTEAAVLTQRKDLARQAFKSPAVVHLIFRKLLSIAAMIMQVHATIR